MNEKRKFRGIIAIVDRRQLLLGAAVLLGMAVLLVVGLTPRTAEAPSAQTGADQTTLLRADCQLIQHLTYAPCGHELTRRMALPEELVGHDRAALEAAYDLWQVTAFSPGEVSMAQHAELYCPEHLVLMADEDGLLCVWQNRYGDAYALVRALELPLTDLAEDVQDTLRQGVSFDDESAVSAYLESIES